MLQKTGVVGSKFVRFWKNCWEVANAAKDKNKVAKQGPFVF